MSVCEFCKYILIYIYMYVCMCIYIVIDIYTYTYVTNSHEIYSHIIKPLQIQEEFTSPIAGNKILGLQKKSSLVVNNIPIIMLVHGFSSRASRISSTFRRHQPRIWTLSAKPQAESGWIREACRYVILAPAFKSWIIDLSASPWYLQMLST